MVLRGKTAVTGIGALLAISCSLVVMVGGGGSDPCRAGQSIMDASDVRLSGDVQAVQLPNLGT